MGRSAHRMPRRRILAAALVALAPLVLPSQVAAQSTLTETDSESATVTLDAPGTVTLDAFDPTLGVLTAVTVSLRVEVLVQNCIENTSSDAASMVAGSATASLDAEFPGGANPTEAAVDASVPSTDLAPSNGGNDCAGGFDEAAGRFPASVTAGDTVYFEQTDQADSTDTLTDSDEMAPFIGSETIEVAYTPQSDTALHPPHRLGQRLRRTRATAGLRRLRIHRGRGRRTRTPRHRPAQQPTGRARPGRAPPRHRRPARGPIPPAQPNPTPRHLLSCRSRTSRRGVRPREILAHIQRWLAAAWRPDVSPGSGELANLPLKAKRVAGIPPFAAIPSSR